MIVAERKPIQEIMALVTGLQRVVVLGCRGCMTVCLAGGEKEVGILAAELSLAVNIAGNGQVFIEALCERQCDMEYFEKVRYQVEEADAVISLACGIGVQYCAERFPDKIVYPALNTLFMGANLELGVWGERCQACGNCVLDKTGGVCPVTRCSKSLFNGPCGGSQGGKCELADDIECGWQLIYDRLKRLNKLDSLLEIQPIKDWSTSREGGPRKLVREVVRLERA